MKITGNPEGTKKFEELFRQKNHILVVHYSCEGFRDRKKGKPSRIATIAVKNYKSGSVKSFYADKTSSVPTDNEEKIMLGKFFQYLNKHRTYYWVHWRMENTKYGFPALKNRFEALGGNPEIFEDSYQFNLSEALIDLYGDEYIKKGHHTSNLESLAYKNDLINKSFLNGEDEVE